MVKMQSKSDAQLLREYAERGAEEAFTELVQRHTNLVYSAALRQVESPHIAAEIAQNVFLSLVKSTKTLAPKLGTESSLAGWLCRSARNLSLNHRRDEFRRHTRERHAMEQLIASSENAPDWEQLRRVLDDAMSELSETDYDALVLRFYQNQEFRSVGAAIGVSDDTAQKRVTRALEKLRELLAHRGIRTTGAALSAVISANAVQSAPIGLAAAISAAALTGTLVTTSTAIATATKIIAMTALQKTVITATVAVLAGAGAFKAHQAAQLREQINALQQQQAPLAEQVQRLQGERDDATNRLANLVAENSRLRSNSSLSELLKLRGQVTQLQAAVFAGENDSLSATANSLAKKANQLEEYAAQHVDKQIPELQLLSDNDWLDAVSGRNLETDKEFREALNSLRCSAKFHFGDRLRKALQGYASENDGQLPGDLLQLKPYFEPPVDVAMLQRYKLMQTGKLNDAPPDKTLVAEKAPLVDDGVDTFYEFRMNGTKTTGRQK